MEHPHMFEEDDPVFLAIRAQALEFPGAAMKVSHGRPAFFTTKIFAYFGGSIRQDGEWVQHPHSIMIQPDPEDRQALESDDRTFVPAYLGPAGWLGIDIDERTSPEEIRELLDASFRVTAPKKLIAELTARERSS